MTRQIWAAGAMLALAFAPLPALAEAADFDCDGAELMVDRFEAGADQIFAELFADPASFVHGTIDRWECMVEPLPQPGQNPYVEELVCAYSTMDSDVSAADLQEAGRVFQRNIVSLTDCFAGEVISEMPQTYMNESSGEAMFLLLDRTPRAFDVHGRPIRNIRVAIEYGYLQAAPRTPIFWRVRVGPSQYEEP